MKILGLNVENAEKIKECSMYRCLIGEVLGFAWIGEGLMIEIDEEDLGFSIGVRSVDRVG